MNSPELLKTYAGTIYEWAVWFGRHSRVIQIVRYFAMKSFKVEESEGNFYLKAFSMNKEWGQDHEKIF